LKKRRENEEINPETRTKRQTKPTKEVRFAKSVDTRLRLQRINRHWLAANATVVSTVGLLAAVAIGLFMYRNS
jgi:hypothetical protein